MPALAPLPETEVEVLDAPEVAPETAEELDWQAVAPMLDRFEGAHQIEHVGPVRRRHSRRHRPFGISGIMVAGAVVFCQFCGLLWIQGMNSGATREVARLEAQIGEANESIARSQKAISAYNSSPHLAQWAAEAEFRPTQLTDFDDVTKKTPPPVLPNDGGERTVP